MASFIRRVAPAAALGGLAIVIVGVADPALAGRASGDVAAADQPAAGQPSQPDQPTQPSQPDQPTQPDTAGDGTTVDSAPPADSGSAPDQGATDGACTGDQLTGDAVQTRWGPVQVTATVTDGTVCAVQAVAWPSNDGRSQQINAYAIPQLDAWATASPTQFDYVSGATYTSAAYHQSLQSILDQL